MVAHYLLIFRSDASDREHVKRRCSQRGLKLFPGGQQDAKRPREPFLQIQATIMRTSASSLPAPQSCQKRQNMLSARGHAAITVEIEKKREQKSASGETPMSASKASLLLNDSYWKSSHGSDRCHPRTTDERPRTPGWTQAAKVRTLGACVNIPPACVFFGVFKRQKRHRNNWFYMRSQAGNILKDTRTQK